MIGEVLFADNCAGCHGADATGGVGPALKDNDITPDQVAAKIVNGGGSMPANVVEGQDVFDVVAYVATLLAGAAPPDSGTAQATETAASSTAAATAEPEPADLDAARTALDAATAAQAAGDPQLAVLLEHTKFLQQALDENNLPNVRFHGEHLFNIVYGNPIRDVDRDGTASNPGDGVGLLGRKTGGYARTMEASVDELIASGIPDSGGNAAAAATELDQLRAVLKLIATESARTARTPTVDASRDRIEAVASATEKAEFHWENVRTQLAAVEIG